MKNKKKEGLILILSGLLIIASGLFIYFVANSTYPNSESTRVQDLNWLLNTIGKTGTALLIAGVGIIPIYMGIRKIQEK